jgi:hypothetical protein
MSKHVRVNEQFFIGSNAFHAKVYTNPPQALVDFASDEANARFACVIGQERKTDVYSPTFMNVKEFKSLKSGEQVNYINGIKDIPEDISGDEEKVATYNEILVGNLEGYLEVAKANAADLIEDVLDSLGVDAEDEEDGDGKGNEGEGGEGEE